MLVSNFELVILIKQTIKSEVDNLSRGSNSDVNNYTYKYLSFKQNHRFVDILKFPKAGKRKLPALVVRYTLKSSKLFLK